MKRERKKGARMGNDWSSESMQRENSVVISTSKLRSERGENREKEREKGETEVEKWSEEEEWDKLSRNIRETRVFSPPVSSSRLIADGEELLPLLQLVGIGSHGNVEKASHLVLNLDQLSINGCEIIIRDSSFSGARCSPRGKNINGPFDILLDNEMRVMIYVLDKSVHNLFIIYCHV